MAVSDFKKYTDANNIAVEIIETKEVTHTAQEAADTHKVPVSNIVKSLLVKIAEDFELHLVPGDKRLDIDKIKSENPDKEVRMASADEVKKYTGYSIGGVPPFGHPQKLKTFIEEGFDKNIQLVAAAGSSNSVFKITYTELTAIIS